KRRSNAAPGAFVSAPGASRIPDPGSEERRRNVTSSTPDKPPPSREPPPVALPKMRSTRMCTAIDSSTNRYTSRGSNESVGDGRRTNAGNAITSGKGGLLRATSSPVGYAGDGRDSLVSVVHRNRHRLPPC